jgi:hypothetical protein
MRNESFRLRTLYPLSGDMVLGTLCGNVNIDLGTNTFFARYFEMTTQVTDTGKGIAQDFLRNSAFSPFTQEDALSEGVGLGVYQHLFRSLF